MGRRRNDWRLWRGIEVLRARRDWAWLGYGVPDGHLPRGYRRGIFTAKERKEHERKEKIIISLPEAGFVSGLGGYSELEPPDRSGG